MGKMPEEHRRDSIDVVVLVSPVQDQGRGKQRRTGIGGRVEKLRSLPPS
jgi:hypothetical protein